METKGKFCHVLLFVLCMSLTLVMPLQAEAKAKNEKNGLKHRVDRLELTVKRFNTYIIRLGTNVRRLSTHVSRLYWRTNTLTNDINEIKPVVRTLWNDVESLKQDVAVLDADLKKEATDRANADIALSDEINTLKDAMMSLNTPLAFATVAEDCNFENVCQVLSGTPNVTNVVWDTITESYIITIDSETYEWEYYTTNVSLISGQAAERIFTQDDGLGHLTVEIYDVDGLPVKGAFQFVVYKMKAIP